jgi:hypothetical protein
MQQVYRQIARLWENVNMRYSIPVLLAALVIVLFCAGCESTAAKWEPVVRVVYMPKKFEDGRITVNPWRQPGEVPYGPSYPYELIYNSGSRLFEVVLREGAPYQVGSQVSYKRDADPYTLIVPANR